VLGFPRNLPHIFKYIVDISGGGGSGESLHSPRDTDIQAECANGNVILYYEGEQGAERVVRLCADGSVIYFEGERSAERRVRAEFADGNVHYFEGEKGAERCVRAVRADGTVLYY
jgi:hypothetical protein